MQDLTAWTARPRPPRAAYERWLAPANFDATGKQKARLEDLR